MCEQSETSKKPEFGKNNISLNFTMEASIQLLDDSSQEAVNLLYFLGCLPGGVGQEDLQEIWNGKNTGQDIDLLESMSLLQPENEDKICLTPFALKYVDLVIDKNDKDKFMAQVATHYMEILSDYYRINNVKDLHDVSQSHDSFQTDSSSRSKSRSPKNRGEHC